MAPGLRELQAAFVAQLLSAPCSETELPIGGDSIPAAARLRIHRHHVFSSLSKALAGTFCTVHRLVGEDCFKSLSRDFVQAEPPCGPVLAEYGATFPFHLDAHPLARELPYLADVARLDWALNLAFHSPLERPLAGADLAHVPTGELPLQRVRLTAGTTVVRSAYPLARIWAACQPDASEDDVELGMEGARLLVFRRPDDAGFVELGEGEAAFVVSLVPGGSLEEAVIAAMGVEPDFDLSLAFARLLALGIMLRCSKDDSVTG